MKRLFLKVRMALAGALWDNRLRHSHRCVAGADMAPMPCHPFAITLLGWGNGRAIIELAMVEDYNTILPTRAQGARQGLLIQGEMLLIASSIKCSLTMAHSWVGNFVRKG